MVQFKLLYPTKNGVFTTKVSIPLWFNSNAENNMKIKEIKKKSQFHYGSIQIPFLKKKGKNSVP